MTADDSPVHRIRLRGPWQFEWIECPSPASPRSGTLDFPMTRDQAFGTAAGTVRLTRAFGRPADPDPSEAVRLEATSAYSGIAIFNGDRLGEFTPGTVRFDVTGRLAFRNRLDLELRLEESAAPEAPLVEVALVFEPNE